MQLFPRQPACIKTKGPHSVLIGWLAGVDVAHKALYCLLYHLFLQLSHVTSLISEETSGGKLLSVLLQNTPVVFVQLCLSLCGRSSTHGFALPLQLDTRSFMLSCGEIQLLCPGNTFDRDCCFFGAQVGLNPGRAQ